jgi:hypothetical protein
MSLRKNARIIRGIIDDEFDRSALYHCDFGKLHFGTSTN